MTRPVSQVKSWGCWLHSLAVDIIPRDLEAALSEGCGVFRSP